MQKGPICVHFGEFCGMGTDRTFRCAKFETTTERHCETCSHHQPYPTGDKVTISTVVSSVPCREKMRNELLEHNEDFFDSDPLFVYEDPEMRGAFSGFYRSLTELFMCYPHRSVFVYLQDDTLLAADARDSLLWLFETKKPKVASLYNPPDFIPKRDHDGWEKHDYGWNTCGACALAFSRDGLFDLLTDPVVLRHRVAGPNRGIAAVDSVVGVWAAKFGGIYYHTEGLAYHVGQRSTLR